MKIVGLEEHFVIPDVVKAWRALDPQWQDVSISSAIDGRSAEALAELGPRREAAMGDAGVDVQLLSLTSPGVQNLAPADAVALQTASNDILADAVRGDPDRLQGLATLATPAPASAAKELERAVTKLGLNGAMVFGRTRDRNVDHPDFWPIFEAAEALRAPLYLHPQSPVPAVRAALYGGLEDGVSSAFATHGIGWYYETGVQLLRMILSGVFDRFPDLQIIVGHWGEVVLFQLDKLDTFATEAKLKRPFSDYVRTNVYVTPSGLFSQRCLRWTVELVGADRIMMSTDYPFVPTPSKGCQAFLADAELSDADREKIASGNWERLCADIRR